MNLLVLGLSHQTAPVHVRERFAFGEAHVPDALRMLRGTGVVEEAVILSTCNRVELYVATRHSPLEVFAELRTFLARAPRPGTPAGAPAPHPSPAEPEGDVLYQLAEPASIQHLFKVACGLDSMVLGETEILGQLKQAYDLALQHRHTGGVLNRAFQKAFNVAKQIRTETSIQRGATSVAAVAVELAERIFNSLEKRSVMVIGAGDTSEKAARALLSRGATQILVSNRSLEKAEALARELGGRAIPFGAWGEAFREIDIVISSTSAPHPILDARTLAPLMQKRGSAPLLLIDIAVPRDIDPEVNYLDNVYLYNVDDLQAIADGYLRQRREELTKCESIIREKAQALLDSRRPTSYAAGPRPALGHE